MRLDTAASGAGAYIVRPAMRGLKGRTALLFCVGIVAIAGCGERDLSKPPKIMYGRDTCARCRMIIEDERFVCAAVSADKRSLKFDDIGCLAVYEKEQNARELRSWVMDAETGRWAVKDQARFVHSRDLVTPMGYGFAAFADAKTAERFSQERAGRSILWEELLNLTGERTHLKMEEVK